MEKQNENSRIGRLRIRVREKATHRTYVVHWPPSDNILVWWATGTLRLVLHTPGYGEYNDRGEPVLDSWIEPTNYIQCG